MWRAVDMLRDLPEGGHVRARWDADKDAFTWHARHLRDGGPPQPRRDGAVSAARRLANMERVQQMVAAQRAFDDPLIMAPYRLAGEAFAGRVVAAEPDRVDATGRRRVCCPRIAVDTDDEVLAGQGAELTSPARPQQKALVTEVIPLTLDGDRTRVVLELQGGMGRSLTPEPGSVPGIGESVCYATFNDGFQRPPVFPDPEDTPWTHGGPPPQYIPSERVAAHGQVTVSTKVADLSDCRVLLSTAHKWATVSADATWPWAVVDEAYQMRSDLLLRVAGRFDRALFVGDPGQLDPFSAVQTDRWTGLTWDPMQSAVAVLLRHNPDVLVHALPVSWRLPESAATVVAQAFYPFTGFRAATGAEQRWVAFSTSPFGINSFDLALETAAASGWALYELPA